jgi:hypothetical protein
MDTGYVTRNTESVFSLYLSRGDTSIEFGGLLGLAPGGPHSFDNTMLQRSQLITFR